jgi:hypothetical protein
VSAHPKRRTVFNYISCEGTALHNLYGIAPSMAAAHNGRNIGTYMHSGEQFEKGQLQYLSPGCNGFLSVVTLEFLLPILVAHH